MYKKQTVKAFSIVAIVLSSIGLLLTVLGTLILKASSMSLVLILGIASWASRPLGFKKQLRRLAAAGALSGISGTSQ